MNRFSLLAIGGVVCLSLGTAPVYARYDEHDARRDCERKISTDRRYKGLRNVHVDSRGNHSYNVSGKVRMKGKDQTFSCRVRHKKVVSWRIDEDYHGRGAVAIGAGVSTAAAIAAMAGGGDDGDNRHQDSWRRYRQGDEDVFEDRYYLRQACKNEVRYHLGEDHGAVERLRFSGVHLNGRTLRGDGEAWFRQGGDRDLAFTCKFDHRGRIYDSYYHYY